MGVLRIAAAAAAFAVGTAAGYRKRCELRDRAVFLAETEQLLERFSADIEYFARTSDELLEREDGKFARLVKSYAKNGADFRKAWDSACGELPKNARETALLKGLGRSLGTTDRDGTIRLLRCCRSEITELKNEAQAEYSVNGKAFFRVGTLCGIGAAVLMI